MTLTNETLDRWLADAKKATNGNWWRGGWKDGEEHRDVVQAEPYPSCIVDICDTFSHDNRNHIANLCPQNAIALIEAVKALRAENEKLEIRVGGAEDKIMKLQHVQAELATLREHRNYASEFLSCKAKCDKYELALMKIAEPHGIGDQPYNEICAMFLRIARKALGK